MGVLLKSEVQKRTGLLGKRPRSSILSSRDYPDAVRAKMRGTPVGIVRSMCSIVPGHSTSPSGAWTTKNCSWGTS